MPVKMARKCHACRNESKELLRHQTYGALCNECSSIAMEMELLVTSWDLGASNDLKKIILQLRRLARRLQTRIQNDTDGSTAKKSVPPDHEEKRRRHGTTE